MYCNKDDSSVVEHLIIMHLISFTSTINFFTTSIYDIYRIIYMGNNSSLEFYCSMKHHTNHILAHAVTHSRHYNQISISNTAIQQPNQITRKNNNMSIMFTGQKSAPKTGD
eukprot:673122_1